MMKRILSLLLTLFLLGGCASRSLPSSNESRTPQADPLSLEEWWDGYLYEMVFPFQGEYPSALPRFDTSPILTCCAQRMYQDGVSIPERDGEYLLPRQELETYVARYFNLSLSDLDLINRETPEGDIRFYSTILSPREEDPAALFHEPFRLESQELLPDGSVRLEVSDQWSEGRKTQFIMAPHPQGEGYYLKSVVPSPSQKVELSGEAQEADGLLYGQVRLDEGKGWVGGKLLLAACLGESGYIDLSLVEPVTLKEQLYTISLEKGEQLVAAAGYGDWGMVQTNRRLMTFQPKFSQWEEMPLPDGLPEETTLSFSPNGQEACFVGEEGLCLLDLKTGDSQLLAPHPQLPQGEGKAAMSMEVYGEAVFQPDGKHIAAKIYGYEWVSGVVLVDVETGKLTTLRQAYSWGGPILGVNGKLLAFPSISSDLEQEGTVMDGNSGTTERFVLPDGFQYADTQVVTNGEQIGLYLYNQQVPEDGTEEKTAQGVYLMDPDTMEFTSVELSLPENSFFSLLRMAPDGSMLASCGGAYFMIQP